MVKKCQEILNLTFSHFFSLTFPDGIGSVFAHMVTLRVMLKIPPVSMPITTSVTSNTKQRRQREGRAACKRIDYLLCRVKSKHITSDDIICSKFANSISKIAIHNFRRLSVWGGKFKKMSNQAVKRFNKLFQNN